MTDRDSSAERFHKMTDAAPSLPNNAFPSEPFPCPACGQMLAAACRVCVSCRRAINPAEIGRPELGTELRRSDAPLEAAESVRFPWRIFWLVLSVSWLAAVIILLVSGPEKTRLLFGAVPLISAVWVVFDGARRRVTVPLRWGLGTLMLWPVFLPWYLARRKTPQARCPFVEGPGMPILLMVVLAVNLLTLLVTGAPKL